LRSRNFRKTAISFGISRNSPDHRQGCMV
jgi:hypothetical protein